METRTLEFSFDEMRVNMGPQHPSTHGVFRGVLVLEGEEIKQLIPHIGYLHRGVEKLAEHLSYVQDIPIMARNDYLGPVHNELVVAHAVEKLAKVQVPERAQYLRVMASELHRIASHLVWMGTFMLDMGGALGGGSTIFLYLFQARESIMDLYEEWTGARFHPNLIQVGGVRFDLPAGFDRRVKEALQTIRNTVNEVREMVEGNPVFEQRTRGVGILPADLAMSIGCSGPVLRASGVPYDVRKAEPYDAFDKMDFEVVTATEGDVRARYWVRVQEIEQAARIVEQALEGLPEGPIGSKPPIKAPVAVKAPKGEVYTRVESARGELGAYLVSDGTHKPYRLKLRSPSFSNLQAIQHLVVGHKVADVVVILGSLDPVFGDVDR